MPICRLSNKKPFMADFALPRSRIDIEVDGDWWHGKTIQRLRDNRRDMELRRHGWHILRVRGSTVEKYPSLASKQRSCSKAKRLLFFH